MMIETIVQRVIFPILDKKTYKTSKMLPLETKTTHTHTRAHAHTHARAHTHNTNNKQTGKLETVLFSLFMWGNVVCNAADAP